MDIDLKQTLYKRFTKIIKYLKHLSHHTYDDLISAPTNYEKVVKVMKETGYRQFATWAQRKVGVLVLEPFDQDLIRNTKNAGRLGLVDEFKKSNHQEYLKAKKNVLNIEIYDLRGKDTDANGNPLRPINHVDVSCLIKLAIYYIHYATTKVEIMYINNRPILNFKPISHKKFVSYASLINEKHLLFHK